MTSDRTRTQVYLDRFEHRRLRRLAAERDVPLTQLVREAVARYLVEEGAGSDVAERFYDDERYAGVPDGGEGLAARMRVRLRSAGPEAEPWSPVADDAAVGQLLSDRHDRAARVRE